LGSVIAPSLRDEPSAILGREFVQIGTNLLVEIVGWRVDVGPSREQRWLSPEVIAAGLVRAVSPGVAEV
jgi:hypothetical protein